MRFPDDQIAVTAVNKNVETVYSDFTPLLFLVRPSTILDSFESNNKNPLKNQACLILKGFYVKTQKGLTGLGNRCSVQLSYGGSRSDRKCEAWIQVSRSDLIVRSTLQGG